MKKMFKYYFEFKLKDADGEYLMWVKGKSDRFSHIVRELSGYLKEYKIKNKGNL